MKGLILKDIYSVRFQIFGGIALMLLPNLMLMLMGGGYFVGAETADARLSIFVYGLMNYITVALCSSFMINTLDFDEKSGWVKMQRAMPVTGGQIIAGKLLAMGAVLGILTGMSLIGNVFGAVVFEISAEPLITMPFIMALLQAAVLSVCFMQGYRFGSRSTLIIYIAAEIVIAAGAVLVLVGLIQENISLTALRIIAYAGVPALTAALMFLSCKFGKKAVMRDI